LPKTLILAFFWNHIQAFKILQMQRPDDRQLISSDTRTFKRKTTGLRQNSSAQTASSLTTSGASPDRIAGHAAQASPAVAMLPNWGLRPDRHCSRPGAAERRLNSHHSLISACANQGFAALIEAIETTATGGT
jgi:hypothetical protein